jgi:hypothetical protein
MATSESRLAQRVLRDFPEPGSAPEVLRLLAELATSTNDEMLASERVHAAVVLVADGNLGRLRQALDLAATDWRDVLVAAGLADADWPQRLDDELGRADVRAWLPAHHSWTDADGSKWTRRKPRWLTERAAKPLALRTSVLLAVEHVSGPVKVERLDHAARKDYWDHHVAGHIDDGAGGYVDPNANGLTYRVSTWINPQGRCLVLLSEMC